MISSLTDKPKLAPILKGDFHLYEQARRLESLQECNENCLWYSNSQVIAKGATKLALNRNTFNPK